ncbi:MULTISPECIES: hypothetical protein [unclassified Halomonas]|uniref:hypothetical protein n=1 Tax=unclassified Halomonas TaxID=2609666 RepID=UPI000990490F|nr:MULTISPECIES: hypothetical protein [unclassified Halomonas]AQU81893.1 hypothetical protein B2G49_04350 [Halomonas sp. 'Soap Lake \
MNNADNTSLSEAPDAVFICNSPLHVYNALQAAHHWGLDTAKCVLVFKIITDKIQLDSTLETLVKWKEVIRIDPFPVPPRLKAKGNKKRYLQYKFFREWQRKLDFAKGVQFVFLCHNRQVDNRVIASYLDARELIWLEDGTLSYFLWQEERVFTPEVRERRSKAAAKKAAAGKKPAVANKATAKKPVVANKTTANKPAVANKAAAKKSAVTKKAVASKKTAAAKKPVAKASASTATIKKSGTAKPASRKAINKNSSTKGVSRKSLGSKASEGRKVGARAVAGRKAPAKAKVNPSRKR